MIDRSKQIGIGVIGAGRIGSLRAISASDNPGTKFLAVCDTQENRVKNLAERCEPDMWTTDYRKVIENPSVDAVFISTTEPSHYEIVLCALEAGKPILVEKPIVQQLDQAAHILKRVEETKVPVFVGYTQRFRKRFFSIKEYIVNGYINEIDSAFAKIYTPSTQGDAVLQRAPTSTPAVNLMTYPIDMLLWYLEGKTPKTLYAQTVKRGEKPMSTWAILTFDDGTVCTIGASRQFPKLYPAHVCTMEMELFGKNGSISIDDSHRESIVASEKPIPSPYLPEVTANVAFIGSAMPGDWALGHFFGPLKEETNAFIETVLRGKTHPVLTTAAHACRVLEISLAIQHSANTGQIVSIPLSY